MHKNHANARRLRAAAALIVLLGAAACGADVEPVATAAPTGAAQGSPAATTTAPSVGSGTARGTVQGQTLTPTSTAFSPFVNDGNFLLLILSNQADYCSATAAGKTHANHRSLVAILTTVEADGSNDVVKPGTYLVHSDANDAQGSFANAVFNASDASCKSIITGDNGAATSGSVVISTLTATQVTGTYSLKFGNDTLTGSFSSPTCQALADQARTGAELTCSP